MTTTPTTIIAAGDFNFRDDLENHITSNYGQTPDKKPDIQITGTRDELARLNLTDQTTVWGISCVITDTPTQPKPIEATVVDRGEQVDFGINQRSLKNPNKK